MLGIYFAQSAQKVLLKHVIPRYFFFVNSMDEKTARHFVLHLSYYYITPLALLQKDMHVCRGFYKPDFKSREKSRLDFIYRRYLIVQNNQ